MVSVPKLCSAPGIADLPRTLYSIDPRKEDTITQAVARWDFSAHAFDDNELVHAAFLMLNHVLRLPELKKWRMPAGKNLVMRMRS